MNSSSLINAQQAIFEDAKAYNRDPTLQWSMHIIGSLSLLSCFGVFWTIFNNPKLQNTVNMMICYLAVCDTLQSLVYVFGASPTYSVDVTNPITLLPCYLQGVTIQFSFVAATAWNLMIALHCYLLISQGERANQYIKFYHMYSWGLGFTLVVVMFMVQATWRGTNGTGYIIGDANFECWISDDYKNYRMYLYYIELWVHFALMIGIYGLVFSNVRQFLASDGVSKQASEKMKRMLYKTVAIAIGFLITWLPASINRIIGLQGYVAPYAMFVIQALTMPAHGLSDSLIFLYFAHARLSSDTEDLEESGVADQESNKIEMKGR